MLEMRIKKEEKVEDFVFGRHTYSNFQWSQPESPRLVMGLGTPPGLISLSLKYQKRILPSRNKREYQSSKDEGNTHFLANMKPIELSGRSEYSYSAAICMRDGITNRWLNVKS